MIELIVLMSERASAPPLTAARAMAAMSLTLGVSLTITGIVRDFLDPARDHASVVGHLADGRAHAALAHAVRAAEIELDAVGAGVLRLPGDRMPGLALRLDHQRDEQRAVGIGLLDASDLLEIHIQSSIGDQLDIIEAHHLAAVVVDRAVA